ncbi:drug resistance transporter, EmrB/QacA subfamily [Virgibacillus subterraneus]|uniref:Drug resistance transporter, EmrB/QacA subfamily n=1 Tax=Virgibacillus subterraneus TaxID=621109 RepID=A0A1H9J2K2_9BACI|nr:MDR family MFS transporter [Virgibacillus subterraneus]SEQ81074.1 drug resistance transporter, EmrB/QacA subfamily [Virgibacillus subterraneus]
MRRIDSKWLVVMSVLFGTFTVILNNSMLNPTLPTFMRLFEVDAVAVSWMLTIFMVSMGMTMPLTGYLGDRFGKKRIYIIGLIIFMIGSISGAVSSDLGMVIISRAIQGTAGGLMMPIAMALIFNAFPKNERGLAVGIYGVAAMVAPAIGPTVGGVVIEFFTWQFLFLFNLPFALLGILFSTKYLAPTEKNQDLKFDLPGFLLISSGVGSILYALGRGATLELLFSPLSIGLILTGLILIFIFVKYENKQEQPLLDLSIFKIPTYTVSIAITATASIGLFSGIFLLPLLIQEVYGLGEIQTGLLFLPAALLSGVFMTLGGRILDKKGPKHVVPIGLVILGGFTLALGFNTLSTSFWFILILNSARGAGLGMCNMPATTAGMNTIPDHQVAQGSAMNNVIRQIFSSFGIVFFSIYYEVRRAQLFTQNMETQQATLQALNEAFMIAGVFILLMVPVSFAMKGTEELNELKRSNA